jgi:hypothetical protein
MVKCPFCHYDNEDGALFCEQCKSDLAAAEPAKAAAAQAIPAATPIEAIPFAGAVEAAPVSAHVMEATVAEAVPLAGMPGSEATIPMATPMEAAPVVTPASAVSPAPGAPAAAPTTPGAAPAGPAAVPAAEAAPLAADAQPRLLVLRGQKRNVEYPIYEGHNFIGRADEKPVDIDLEDQEPPDRVWSSRQHALITFESGKLMIEDLNSSNGTFVNRGRIYPGQKKGLSPNDVVQIGNVQLKVIV